jgi:hypothetical protein
MVAANVDDPTMTKRLQMVESELSHGGTPLRQDIGSLDRSILCVQASRRAM